MLRYYLSKIERISVKFSLYVLDLVNDIWKIIFTCKSNDSVFKLNI